MEYTLKKFSFDEFLRYEFEDDSVFDYEITYRDVPFRFLINVKKDSDKAIVLGTGAIKDRKNVSLPIYSRSKWINEFDCVSIYYFDPTVLLNEDLNLAWCYGTDDHWYLESIAFLIKIIFDKLKISISNSLFFGSSGGGYTSILLATMLRGRTGVINTQFILKNYSEIILDKIKSELNENSEIEEKKTNAFELIKTEGYFPFTFVLQNINSTRDITSQLIPFLLSINEENLEIPYNSLNISFYHSSEGHNGMPSKGQTLDFINKCLDSKYINSYDIVADSFMDKYYGGYYLLNDNFKLGSIVSDTVLKYENNQIIFSIHNNIDLHCFEYAYYLICNEETIEKKMYTNNNTCYFKVYTHGKYRVKYFIKVGKKKESYYSKQIVI